MKIHEPKFLFMIIFTEPMTNDNDLINFFHLELVRRVDVNSEYKEHLRS
jgi:hypothetical protein